MNFIPDFFQLLSSVPNTEYAQMDKNLKLDDLLDDIEEHSKKKKKTIPTNNWVYFQDWNKKQIPILVIKDGRSKYLFPKITSIYPKYDGSLLEIYSRSKTYIKPSTQVKSNSNDVKAKELQINDQLDFLVGEQIIQKIETVNWKGDLFSLSFEFPCYLPIKFDNEYILIPC